MSKKDAVVEIEETAAEARESFDLKETLMGTTQLDDEVTVFTDRKLGRRHQELSLALEAAQLVDDGTDESKERIAELEKDVRDIATQVYKTGLTLTLRAVPEIVIKDIKRKTRKKLGIKGSVPADRLEEYNEHFTAGVFSKVIEKITRLSDGKVVSPVSFEAARDLEDYLHHTQYAKIDNAVGALQFNNAISETVTADADF